MATISFDVKMEGMSEIQADISNACKRSEHILAAQMAKDTSQFVPARTLSLDQRTQVKGNTIIYPGPYARYLYNGMKMVDSATGKGPMKIVSKDGSVSFRFSKGAVLRPTDEPLNIRTTVHRQAQSHWFEASKAQNLQKWVRVADKAVKDDL